MNLKRDKNVQLLVNRSKRMALECGLAAACVAGCAALNPMTLRAQGCASEPPGIVNWWPGEGTTTNDPLGFADIRGSQVPPTTLRFAFFSLGKVGQAFGSPSGSPPTVIAALPQRVGPFTELTIEGWINTAAAGTGGFQAIISSTLSEFVRFQLFDGTGNMVVYTDAGPINLSLIPEGPAGVWRHVALTSKSGDTRVFVNGVQREMNPATFNSITASNDVWIGGGVCDAGTLCFGPFNQPPAPPKPAVGRIFQGMIDELTIYNRALSPQEIQNIVAADSLGKCQASRLISRLAQGAQNWATEFQILSNPSATPSTKPISYTLRFFDAMGAPLPLPLIEGGASLGPAQSTVIGTLQPDQSRFIETSVGTASSPILAGYARLESTDPRLEVKATLSNFFAGDINKGSRSSIPSLSSFQTKLRLPVRSTNATAEFPALQQLNTCVAVTSGGDQTIELRGIQKGGGSTCATTMAMNANQHSAFCVKDANTPVSCLTNSDGVLEVNAPKGAAAMSFTFDNVGRFYTQAPLIAGP